MSRLDDIKTGDPGGDLQVAFDAMKVETKQVFNTLSSAQLNKWAAANSARKAIMMASEDYGHVAYELAAAARSNLENINSNLDLSDPEVMLLINGLEAAGLITTPAKQDLIARATTTKLKYPHISVGKLMKARAL